MRQAFQDRTARGRAPAVSDVEERDLPAYDRAAVESGIASPASPGPRSHRAAAADPGEGVRRGQLRPPVGVGLVEGERVVYDGRIGRQPVRVDHQVRYEPQAPGAEPAGVAAYPGLLGRARLDDDDRSADPAAGDVEDVLPRREVGEGQAAVIHAGGVENKSTGGQPQHGDQEPPDGYHSGGEDNREYPPHDGA